MSEQPPKVRTKEEIQKELDDLELNPEKLKAEDFDKKTSALEKELKQANNLSKKEKNNRKDKEPKYARGTRIWNTGSNNKENKGAYEILETPSKENGYMYLLNKEGTSIMEPITEADLIDALNSSSGIIRKEEEKPKTKKTPNSKKNENKKTTVVENKILEKVTKGRNVWFNDKANGGNYIVNETPAENKDKKYVLKKESGGGNFRVSAQELEKLLKDEKVQVVLKDGEYEFKKPEVKNIVAPAVVKSPTVPATPTKTPDTKNKIKTPEDAKKEYWDFIRKAVDLIKANGLDRVVIHGDETKNKDKLEKWNSGYTEEKHKEQGPILDISPDLDTRGALLFLNKIQEANSNIFKKGAFIETIPKGTEQTFTKTKNKGNELVLYMDVGGKNPSVEIGGKKINIFADHHGTEGGFTTSATQIMKDIAVTGGLSLGNKEETEFLNKTSSFIAKFDNLAYLDDKKDKRDPKSERLVDEKYLRNTFPRSLYSLAKFLPFETTLEILGNNEKFEDGKKIVDWKNPFLKDGKPRDWANTFTDDEIEKGDIGKIVIDYKNPINGEITKMTVKELVKKNKGDINYTIKGEETALKNQGKNTESSTLGKFVFHNFADNGKGKTNTIPKHMAYLTSRALGYDAFVSYNPESGAIFINSDGKKDLMPVWEKLNAIIPGYPKPVRNQMMFAPKDPEMMKKMKDISQEKLLEILGARESKEKEIISDKEYTDFVDKNKVSTSRLESLADKVIARHQLSTREQAIFNGKTSEINKIIEERSKQDKKENKTADLKKDINKKIDDKDKKKDDKTAGPTAEDLEKQKREKADLMQAVISAREELFAAKNSPEGFFTKFKAKWAGKASEKEKSTTEKEKAYFSAKKAYIEKLPAGSPEINIFILSEMEIVKARKIENLPLSERIKNGISKGIKWWEEIGTNPDDSTLKRFGKKTAKALVAIGIIGGASAAAVSGLAAVGIGSASALGAGATSYLGRKMLMSVGMSSAMSIMPPGAKSLFAKVVPMFSVAGALGYGASKAAQFATNKWLGEESITNSLNARIDALKNSKNETESLDSKLKRMEKEYAEIHKSAENKRFGRRLMGGVVALGTSIAFLEYGGHKIDQHNLETQTHAVPEKHPEIIHKEAPVEQNHGINTKVEFSSNGAIATLDNLKGELNKQYHGDFSHAPKSVQEFMNTNSTQAAINLGMFHPNDPTGNESMMIMRGSTISFDEHGNLSYHDIQKNIDHTLIEGDKNSVEQYHGNMFHAGNSDQQTHNYDENLKPVRPVMSFEHNMINETNDVNHSEVPIAEKNMTYTEEAEKENADNNVNVNENSNTENNNSNENTETTQVEHFGLHADKLAEVFTVHDENINKLFEDQKVWDSVSYRPANFFIEQSAEDMNDTYKPFIEHIQDLHEKSGLEPRASTILMPAETADQYIERALEKIASEDKLEEVKL
ncbi:MAG: hypothetical protein NTW62_02160 [Candidatus Nomurabacteria bacterium]|nr:hypothetical protein [Candidatus Nomurabacteria bacterium]